jgi:hypothetical protein
MRKLLLASLLLILAVPVLTQATVIGFGPLCGTSCTGIQVPDGYGDANFTWGGSFYAYGNDPYDSSFLNTYGAPSGAFAYNAFGDSPITMSSSVPFYFNGAYFSTWAESNQFASFSSLTIEIQGYNGANLVGTVVANLSPNSFDFVTADFSDVTSLVFTNSCGNCSGQWWLMDNFTYNQQVGTTPEPGTMITFGSGLLIAIGAIRRRFSA